MAHQNVSFPSNGEEAYGYLALPESGSGPGLIVIQEWWGLTDHIKEMTDRFAAEGFVALAPDLYGGSTTHDAGEAGRMMQELPIEQAVRDLSGAVDYLLGHEAVEGDSVGAVGFCMGGGFVIALAAQEGDRIGAAVPYYGVGAYDQVSLAGITADMLGHFAADDSMATPEVVEALRARIREEAGVDPDFRIHEGAGHAFCNDRDHMGTYDADLADSTLAESARFLRERLAAR